MPLQPVDLEPLMDLQRLLNNIYDNSGYDLKLNYQEDPVPPLNEPDAAWLNALLTEQHLR